MLDLVIQIRLSTTILGTQLFILFSTLLNTFTAFFLTFLENLVLFLFFIFD